jgi:hypothetical protein
MYFISKRKSSKRYIQNTIKANQKAKSPLFMLEIVDFPGFDVPAILAKGKRMINPKRYTYVWLHNPAHTRPLNQ